MTFLRILKAAIENKSIPVLLTVIISFIAGITQAQTNPYRYGTPNYWMAQATLDITAGKFDKAYKDLQKARKGYKALGDISYQVNANRAMGLLKSNMGEWALAQQHFQEALDIATKANDEISLSGTLVETVSFCKRTGDVKGYNLFIGKLDSLYKKTSSAIVKTYYHTYWSNEYVMRQEYAMAEYHLQQCRDVMQELPLMEREQAKLSHYNNMMALCKQKKIMTEPLNTQKIM